MKRTAVGATPWSSAACRWPAGTSSTLPPAARRRTRRRQISPRHFFQVSQLKEGLSFGTLTIRKRRTDKIATNKGGLENDRLVDESVHIILDDDGVRRLSVRHGGRRQLRRLPVPGTRSASYPGHFVPLCVIMLVVYAQVYQNATYYVDVHFTRL